MNDNDHGDGTQPPLEPAMVTVPCVHEAAGRPHRGVVVGKVMAGKDVELPDGFSVYFDRDVARLASPALVQGTVGWCLVIVLLLAAGAWAMGLGPWWWWSFLMVALGVWTGGFIVQFAVGWSLSVRGKVPGPGR